MSDTQTNLKKLQLTHNFLKLIQTRLEQLLTRWHDNALEFVIKWPFRAEGISSTRLLSWVLALSSVQIVDRVFLDDANHDDYVRSKKLFWLQLVILIVHVLCEIAPYIHYDLLQNRIELKTVLCVLCSREGAKASWLLINLIACVLLTDVVKRVIQCKPLLLVATLALANASVAYFVKSVVVDSTYFETITASYTLAIVAHPLLVYAGHVAYSFNAFLCAVYKTSPEKRELSSKLIDLTSRLSTALLIWGITFGAYCNYTRGGYAWSWDHIEYNTLLFCVLNLLTVHLIKLGGRPRDSMLGYQMLACPLSIIMTYAIHHNLIPTNHGIGGCFGRGSLLAWMITITSAVFVLALFRSVWECLRAVSARKHKPPYGLALACVLFVMIITSIIAFAVFEAPQLGLIAAGVTVMCAWFGISVLTFDLYNNKHSFIVAALAATILIHTIANSRYMFIEQAAIGYYSMGLIKHLYRLVLGKQTNVAADFCHLSVTCALVFAGLSRVNSARKRVQFFQGLASLKLMPSWAHALKLNVAFGLMPDYSNYACNGFIITARAIDTVKLSSLCFNIANLALLLTQIKKWAD
ncbi:MAG: hypothetical protein AAI978_00780 [Candidatus Hodgkinia cicadicola]